MGLALHAYLRPTTLEWPEVKRSIRAEFPDVRQISTGELADWLGDATREPPILLDARAPEEFAVSHLRNARLAPDPRRALLAIGDVTPDTPIVVYCSVGYRSSRLAENLLGSGFANVSNLEGSIFQWANEQRPVYRGPERVRTVHPYDDAWGRLLDPGFRGEPDE